tara:strand:+ start:201 stop:500 length:300 start_codon:yes stop_codon:yes gene_type:complete
MNFLDQLIAILESANKAKNILISIKISDHWKEKVIVKYALQIMKYSLNILLIFLLVFLVFFILSLLEKDFLVCLLSVVGIIESIIVALIYIKVRNILSI